MNRIRRFIEEDCDGFLRCALPILKNQGDSIIAQHLVRVLVSNGLLLRASWLFAEKGILPNSLLTPAP